MTLVYNGFQTDSTTGVPGFDLYTADTTGKYGFVVNNGSAATDTTSASLGFPQGVTPASDQFAQVTFANTVGASTGLVIRFTPTGSGATGTGYIVRSNGSNIALIAIDATNTAVTLGTPFTKTRAVGDIIRVTAQGTVLKVYSTTEASPDYTTPVITYDTASDAVKYSTGRSGIRGAGTLTTRLDNFYSGDFADQSGVGAPAPTTAPTLTLGTTTENSQGLTIGTVSGAAGYLVEYKLTSASTWTTFGTVAGPTTTVTGLTAATSYDYRASASNAAGTGPTSTVRTATTSAATVITTTVNQAPTDGIPKWKGLVYAPSGRILLPGKPLHRMHADFFGPSGTYTPPSWLTVTGTAMLTDPTASLSRLELSTGPSVGSVASLALNPSLNSGSWFAIRVDVEAMNFTVKSPNAKWRLGAAGGTNLGGGAMQTPAEDNVFLYSGGENNRTKGVFSHLGDTADQRRQTSVIINYATKHVFLLEDDEVIAWRDGTTGWTDGLVTPSLSIEATTATAVALRLASITYTLYA